LFANINSHAGRRSRQQIFFRDCYARAAYASGTPFEAAWLKIANDWLLLAGFADESRSGPDVNRRKSTETRPNSWQAWGRIENLTNLIWYGDRGCIQ
jgi:hypothetical protein